MEREAEAGKKRSVQGRKDIKKIRLN